MSFNKIFLLKTCINYAADQWKTEGFLTDEREAIEWVARKNDQRCYIIVREYLAF